MTARPARLRALTIAFAAVALGALAAPAAGLAANPWTTPANQFLNIAHQGGEEEVPGNTLYAFKTALRDRGADVVEMDTYISADGELVVGHDATLYGTTNFGTPSAPPPFNAPGASDKVWDYTVAELKALDDAYWFSPGKGQYGHNEADPHPFRGVATGSPAPPSGYSANDFRIPTFKEVLAALPADTKYVVEIKAPGAPFEAKGIAAAQELAAILAAQPGGDNENVMVASFRQAEIEAFHAALPQHDSLSGSLAATQGYTLNNPSIPFGPEVQAIQPPDKYDLGGGVVINAPEVIKSVVERNNDDYAIHVWGADGTDDTDALFQRMVDAGVQGYMPLEPSKLTAFLCANHVPDATGTPRCTTTPIGPIGQLGKLKGPKGKVKAGKTARVKGSISNGGDQPLTAARACVEIPKKLRKALKAKCVTVGDVAAGADAQFTIKVKTTKKAKGRYKLAVAVTSADGGRQNGKVALRVKRAKR
ncbi:MAG: glycerophosphodiester phosphodiesterase family protein [Solirubrobacterales bacterium]